LRISIERRRPGRLRGVSAERMGNDGDARSQARGGGGGRPSSGKTTRTSRSKKDKLQKAMRDMELERGEDNGSWLTEELLMLFEDEDGEFLNFTPSVRSRVTLASKKVRKKGNVRPSHNARASSIGSHCWGEEGDDDDDDDDEEEEEEEQRGREREKCVCVCACVCVCVVTDSEKKLSAPPPGELLLNDPILTPLSCANPDALILCLVDFTPADRGVPQGLDDRRQVNEVGGLRLG